MISDLRLEALLMVILEKLLILAAMLMLTWVLSGISRTNSALALLAGISIFSGNITFQMHRPEKQILKIEKGEAQENWQGWVEFKKIEGAQGRAWPLVLGFASLLPFFILAVVTLVNPSIADSRIIGIMEIGLIVAGIITAAAAAGAGRA